eukprot:s397_g59.t3
MPAQTWQQLSWSKLNGWNEKGREYEPIKADFGTSNRKAWLAAKLIELLLLRAKPRTPSEEPNTNRPFGEDKDSPSKQAVPGQEGQRSRQHGRGGGRRRRRR